MNLFNYHFTDLLGNRLYLDRYRNVPFLVVNVATESRFIPQMQKLQQTYALHSGGGLRVLALPCNDFGEEPRDEAEIDEFLRENYSVSFLISGRVSVTGQGMHPLFRDLMQERGGTILPSGTFFKYLFDGRGELVGNWPPETLPDDPALIHSVQRHLPSRSL